MGEKRFQFDPAFEDCSRSYSRKTGAKWDFSPPIAADSLLPRRLLTLHVFAPGHDTDDRLVDE